MATILLIEDNPAMLENLAEFLELEGYRILIAENGEQGIELATVHVPDLIICDTKMPVMDGYEVLRNLISLTITHDIPFIFSTSNSEEIDRTNALALGADEYIIKPFELDTLLQMARNCIQTGSKRLNEPLNSFPVAS